MAEVKNYFKVPEGRYELHSARTMGLVPFAMRRTTRLTIATLHGGEQEGMYMVYNVGDYLHITPFDATEKVRAQQLRICPCLDLLLPSLCQLQQSASQAASHHDEPTTCSVAPAGAHLLIDLQPISSAGRSPMLPCILVGTGWLRPHCGHRQWGR
jgi:hypothetical protein